MIFSDNNIQMIFLGIILLDFLAIIITSIISSRYNPNWEVSDDQIYSTILGDTLQLYIGLPRTYDPESTTKYHSVYLLDGMYYFNESSEKTTLGGVLETMRNLVYKGEIPDSILLGIGYPDGWGHRERYVHADAELFRRFFREELIPHIEYRYNVIANPDGRALLGHSGAAHFAVYELMKDGRLQEETFSRFVAVSGAYDETRNAYIEEESLYSELGINGLQGKILFMPVGTDDFVILPWGEKPKLVDAHRVFAEKLKNRQYSNLNLECPEYDGLGHWDIQEYGFEEGLKWIFEQTIIH
ncbi:MAG: alpha/beta hydrolase [Candidatus Kariarchaeaceae archaeon]|jgi:enterochelin esterase-like enzyme